MGKYSDWHPNDLFLLLDDPIAEIHDLLEVDAMYYSSAVVNYDIAKNQKKDIELAIENLKNNDDASYLEAYNWGDDIDLCSGEDVPIFIKAAELLDETYSLYIRSLATVHIFCVLCLEAHINQRAKEILSGKIRDEFDRFSVEAKWLTLPMFKAKPSYNVGTEPFQTFSKLIKIRNVLVHFKASTEKWSRSINPDDKASLGFTLEEAQASLNTTKSMITFLSSTLEVEEPQWVYDIETKFFKNVVNNHEAIMGTFYIPLVNKINKTE